MRHVYLIKTTTMVWYFKLVFLTHCCVTSLFQMCVKYISQKRVALKIQRRKKKKNKKTSAPMVPVRAHLFTSHAFLSPLGLVHVNSHLHSHLAPACGPASSHPPGGVCCLRFPASLIDLATSSGWAESSSSFRPIWLRLQVKCLKNIRWPPLKTLSVLK